jgi:Ca2+-binding RTX toxin-like protein
MSASSLGDNVTLGGGADTLNAAGGADTIYALGGADTIYGDGEIAGFDGTSAGDYLEGGDDNDRLFGGGTATTPGGTAESSGADTLLGQGGDDFLYGSDGGDSLFGGDGNDSIDAGDGADTAFGDDAGGTAGADSILGFAGDDRLFGGTGTNTETGGAGDADTLSGWTGNDSLYGEGGDDVLLGGAGADSILGGDGNDVIEGGLGADRMVGGAGADTLSYADAGDAGAGQGVYALLDTFSNPNVQFPNSEATGDVTEGFEALIGSQWRDTLVGNDLDNTIAGGGGDGNDSIVGGGGNDSLLGNAGNNTIDGGADNDTIVAGGGIDSVLGGSGADSIDVGGAGTIDGGAGNDTILGGAGGPFYRILGGDDDDLIIERASGTPYTMDGGTGDDTLAFDQVGVVTISGSLADFTYTVPGGGTGTARSIEFIRDASGNGVSVASILGTSGTGTLAVCFAEGTRILTTEGEVAVERLRAGDTVVTVAGGSPLAPVLWVGRRRIVLAGHPQAAELAPIRIRAGALGEHVPHRDLLVSPDHCLFLDGGLVPARLLVNGTSIVVEHGLPEVTYFHVEVEGHAVLLAEGAPAESWLDAGNRAWFANAPVALARVDALPDSYATAAGEPCAPVLHGGPRLAAIRDAIALRSAASVPPRRASA